MRKQTDFIKILDIPPNLPPVFHYTNIFMHFLRDLCYTDVNIFHTKEIFHVPFMGAHISE